MWNGAWNKRKLTSEISNWFLPSSVGRARDWWSEVMGSNPTGGNFLMKYILFCVTSDLSDNLIEMRQIALSHFLWISGTQMDSTDWNYSLFDFTDFFNSSFALHRVNLCQRNIQMDWNRNCQIDSNYCQTNVPLSGYNREWFNILYYEENFTEGIVKLFLHVYFGLGRYQWVYCYLSSKLNGNSCSCSIFHNVSINSLHICIQAKMYSFLHQYTGNLLW